MADEGTPGPGDIKGQPDVGSQGIETTPEGPKNIDG